jgi:hypothetical protein
MMAKLSVWMIVGGAFLLACVLAAVGRDVRWFDDPQEPQE